MPRGYSEKFLITPASVKKHIAYIEEVRQATAGRDEERPAATGRDKQTSGSEEPRQPPTSRDVSQHAEADTEYATQLEKRLGEKDGEIVFLRSEIAVKTTRSKTSPSALARLTAK